MAKTVDDEIADLQAKLKDAEEKKRQAENPTQEYPKWVTDPNDPSVGFVVANKDEESKVKKGVAAGQASKTFDLTPEEEEAKKHAKAEADKDAAGAESRLGPDASTREGRKAKAAKSKGKR